MSIVNVKDFGAVGDDATDDTASFEAALTHITSLGGTFEGATLYVPKGRYRLSRSLHFHRPTLVQGDGGYHFQNQCSMLKFAEGVAGLVFHFLEEDATTGRADGSVVRDLMLHGSHTRNVGSTVQTYNPAACGVIMFAPFVALENVTVAQFAGDGVRIATELATSGLVANTQPNLWAINRASIARCGGDGVNVYGQDSNAGLATMVSVVECTGWGINDHSFLGNTYVQCHVRDNTLGAYRGVGDSNTSAFVGCYSEGAGFGPSSNQSPMGQFVTVLGGVHATKITGPLGGSDPVVCNYTSAYGGARVMSPVSIWSEQTVGAQVRLYLKYGGTPHPVLQFYAGAGGAAAGNAGEVLFSDSAGSVSFRVTGDDTNNGGMVSASAAGSPQARFRPNKIEVAGKSPTDDLFVVDQALGGTGAAQRWRRIGSDVAVMSSTGDLTLRGWAKPGRYTSSTRPPASVAGVGAQIYDTTLSKPIWSDGAVWRDAIGVLA